MKYTLPRNVGPTERWLRIAAGLAAGAAALSVPRLRELRIPLAIAGAIGVITGSARRCPVNQALGVDNFTRGVERTIAKERRRRELQPSPELNRY